MEVARRLIDTDSNPADEQTDDPGALFGEVTFADFYGRTRDSVYRTILLATRSPERAEDAVQEAYTKALAAWDSVAIHPNPVAWVVRVALNQATSWWRRRRRELREPPDHAGGADEQPMDDALIQLVWALPRRQRQVVAIRVLLDQSTDETARLLGLSPGTVKAHLHRGLASLRSSLTAMGWKESNDD